MAQAGNYGLLKSEDDLARLCDMLLEKDKTIGFDLETGYIGEDRAKGALDIASPYQYIVGCSISGDKSWARYVPLGHDYAKNLDVARCWQIMKPMLEQGKIVAHNCFSGETEFVTREGVRSFESAVGESVEVLTASGWRKADVRQYGHAEVLEVELAPANNSRTSIRHRIRATANHRWELIDGSVVTTAQLKHKDRIKAQVNRDAIDTYSTGFIHGLIYADGALSTWQPKDGQVEHQLRLCGWKSVFADRFERATYPASANGDPVCQYRSPVNMKELPSDDASVEYIAAFIEGWQLLDGTTGRNRAPGVRVLNAAYNIEPIEWLMRNAVYAGWVVSGYSLHETQSGYSRKLTPVHYVTLSRMASAAWGVKSVTSIDGTVPVYCAEVPEVERLTLAGGIYTANSKFEKRNLQKVGINMRMFGDTMLDSYVLSETQWHGLKELVKIHFGHEMMKIETLFPSGATSKQLHALRFNVLDLTPEVVAYACEDAAWCLALYELLHPKAVAERKFMIQLELQIADLMSDVETHGVAVDWEGLEKARAQVPGFVARYESAVRGGLSAMAGRDLSTLKLGSTKQMGELLYNDQSQGGLGLKTSVMTKGSDKSAPKQSTNAIALEGLSRKYPAIKKLLELREVNNLANRIGKWLDEYRTAEDGRVHPNFSQTVVGTGRFAANDPPIQQLPKDWRWATSTNDDVYDPEVWAEVQEKGENGKEYWQGNFRNFIIAGPGNYLLTFDYSQIELRVMAGVSQESELMKAFNEDRDVHTLTAAQMLGKKPEDVTKQDRAIGKTMNFALLYGMGAKSLSDRLALTEERAKELYAAYFAGFPSITTWMSRMKAEGRERGYTLTPFGRKYTVWELQSGNRAIYSKGERVLVNAPIQGGAADYMKIAMIRVTRALQDKGWWNNGCTIIMNQHDSLTFEVSNELNPQEVRDLIEPRVAYKHGQFPKIVADWELGQRWGSSTPWKQEAVVFSDGRWQVVKGDHPQKPDEPPVSSSAAPEPLPESAPQVAQPVAVAEPVLVSEGSTVVVEVAEMPTLEQFSKLLDMMRRKPGDNRVVLETPEGSLELEDKTSLCIKDAGQFSLALGGARTRTPIAEVDLGAIAAGVSL